MLDIQKKTYTDDERKEIIRKCDLAISAHSRTSLDLAKWIAIMDASKAFLLTHPSLPAYMQEKHGIERRRVYQLLKAGNMMQEMVAEGVQNFALSEPSLTSESQPKLTEIIKNEAQACALGEIPKEKRAKVLETLVDAGVQITAEAIKVAGAALESNEKMKPKAAPKKNDELLPHVQEAFDHRYEFDAIIHDLCLIEEKVRFLHKKKFGVFLDPDFFHAHMENAKGHIIFAKPYADCVLCQQKGCKRCRQRGWTGNDLFKVLTDDLKAQSRVRGKKK